MLTQIEILLKELKQNQRREETLIAERNRIINELNLTFIKLSKELNYHIDK